MSLLFAAKAYHRYGQYRAFRACSFRSLDRSLSVKSSQSFPIVRSYQAISIPFRAHLAICLAFLSPMYKMITLSRAGTILGTIGKTLST